MKKVPLYEEFLSSQDNDNYLYEYTSYRISNAEELLKGLEEIGAPVKIDIKQSSVIIDGVRYSIPKNLKDSSTSIKWDDKLVDALHKNEELNKMWKVVNSKYSTILKNFRGLKSLVGYIGDPEHINWGPTGPAQINSYFQKIVEIHDFLKDLIANPEAQDILRKYEILRHLYDRGYSSMFGLK
jgi:hypothetical protein